nr:hypothetical protein [Tanacetum cinerariifolium]
MEYAKNSIRNGLSAESHARKNLNHIVKKIEENPDVLDPLARVYKCKALGGHMRKHKRMKHEAGEVKTADSNNVGHALQQPKVEALQELEVEALHELNVDVLQEQKAKSDRSEGVMSKDDNFKEETATSDSDRQEFHFVICAYQQMKMRVLHTLRIRYILIMSSC